MNSKNLFDSNLQDLSQIIKSIQSKSKELGFAQIRLLLDRYLMFSGNDICNKESSLIIEGYIQDESKINLLKSYIGDIQNEFDSKAFKIRLNYGLGINDLFPTLTNLISLSSKKDETLSPREGEILLIDFWSSKSVGSERSMSQNLSILKNYKDLLTDRVRFIGISLDESIETAISTVETKGWNVFEHFCLPHGVKSEIAKELGIAAAPLVIIINSDRRIHLRGHPVSTNIEKNLLKLLKIDQNEENEAEITLEKELEVTKVFEENHQMNKHLISKARDLTVGSLLERTYTDDDIGSLVGKIFIAGVISENDEKDFAKYYQEVVNQIPSQIKKDNRMIIKTFYKVEYGTSCSKCQKKLSKDVPHYLCTLCQFKGDDIAFCKDCAEEDYTKTITSPSQLVHIHGLLYVNEASEDKMNKIKRLMHQINVIDENHPEYKNVLNLGATAGVGCDICGCSPLFGYRWSCLNCDDYDLCHGCFSDKQKHLDKVFESGHELKSHLMFRSHFLSQVYPMESKIANPNL